METRMKDYQAPPPSEKGISIRQIWAPPSKSLKHSFSGGIDTLVYLDGKLLSTVQAVEFKIGVADIVTEVKLTMIAETVDIDLLDPKIEIIGKAKEEREYVLGHSYPILSKDAK